MIKVAKCAGTTPTWKNSKNICTFFVNDGRCRRFWIQNRLNTFHWQTCTCVHDKSSLVYSSPQSRFTRIFFFLIKIHFCCRCDVCCFYVRSSFSSYLCERVFYSVRFCSSPDFLSSTAGLFQENYILHKELRTQCTQTRTHNSTVCIRTSHIMRGHIDCISLKLYICVTLH